MAVSLALGSLASVASAAPPRYDLRGTWTSTGKNGAASGTLDFTNMNMVTGAFSGTATVSGIHFTVKGTESGSIARYDLSEGNYTAHDTLPLSILPDGHLGGDGSFTDGSSSGKFHAEQDAPYNGAGKPPKGTSFTSVICNIFPSTPSMSGCTATVGDAGAPPRHTPTGSVKFSSPTGTFTAGDTCTLAAISGSPGVASCTVAFQPAPGTPAGALPVTAAYSGDGQLARSKGGTGPAAGVLGANPVTAAPNGNVPVPVANPNGAGLTGTLTLGGASFANSSRVARTAGRHRVHVSVSLQVKRYGVKVVRPKLDAATRKYLTRNKRLRVTVRITGRVRGHRVTKTYRLTLRAPRRS